MANLFTFVLNFMPHRLIGAALLRRVFMRFARTNGLVYFGMLLSTDDYEPARGFTSSTGQIDNHVVHGTVHGRDVTLLQRTVTHADPHSKKMHSHTWLIASVTHEVPHSPSLLLLSHEHPRLHDEAVAIHHSKSQHLPLEYRVDAKFLVYGKPAAVQDFKEASGEDTVQALLSQPAYDYEIDSERLYVYGHTSRPTEAELNHLLHVALTLVAAYEG